MITSIDSAASILGSIFLDSGCLGTVREEILAEMFPLPTQRDIFKAACALQDEGKPVDPVTIGARVREMGGEWSNEYCLQLMEITPTSANVTEWCKLLRRDAMARTLEDQTRLASDALASGQDPLVVAQDLASALEDIQKVENTSGTVTGSDAMIELFDTIQSAEEKRPFHPTRYRVLDRILGGGLMDGCLYILAARPGQGKTTLGSAIAERIAERGKTVLFISLEMTRAQLSARRVAALVGTVTATQILTGDLDSSEMDKVTEAMTVLSGRRLIFNRRSKVSVKDIRWLAKKNGADMIVIDYLGLLQHGEGRGLYERVTETSNQLKQMSIELNIPVLCLAQLNREIEGRNNGEPRLSDLRDSGAIEQDADAVLLLHRYEAGDDQKLTPLDVVVAKNRYGPIGKVALGWSVSNGRIVD